MNAQRKVRLEVEQLEDRVVPAIASNNGVTFCDTTPPPQLIPLTACTTPASEHITEVASVHSEVVFCVCPE
jgi:hypothetical protein